MQTATNSNGVRPSNAEIAAELAAMNGTPDAPPPAAAAKPATEAAAPPADEPAEEAEAKEAEPVAAEPAAEAEPDPATARSLAMIAKAEKRQKEQIAAERKAIAEERATLKAEIEAERAKWQKEIGPLAEAAKAFEALKARAKFDPDSVLDALGIDGDDVGEAWSRAAWARTAKGKSDPSIKATAYELLRKRETANEVAEAKREAQEAREEARAIRKMLEDQKQAAVAEAAVNNYLGAAQKAITPDAAPAMARWIEKAPQKARQFIHAIAAEIAQEEGEPPAPAELIAEAERRRIAALEEDGIDPTVLLGAPVRKPAGTPPGKTLGRAPAAPTTPKPKLSGKDLVEDIKRKVEAGQFDD